MTTSDRLERLERLLTDESADAANLRFNEQLRADTPILVYGAGNKGGWVLEQLSASGIGVRAFLDRNADAIGSLGGVPVWRPDGPELAPDERRAALVLIVTRKRFYAEIEAALAGLGYGNVVPYVCIWYMGASEPPLNSIARWRAELLGAARLFEEEASLAVFEQALCYYVEGRVDRAATAYDTQYFPRDVSPAKGYARFVDCGAFDGDTIEALHAAAGTVEALVAFEPSPAMYTALCERLRSGAGRYARQAFAYPCAVGRNLAQLRFTGTVWSGGCLSATGEERVQAVALDDALAGFAPTCIKMDIEGGEYAALLGARRIVERHRPDLVISVYHSLADFGRIPCLLRDWDLGYRFRLRAHSDFNEETILYATAEGQAGSISSSPR